MGLNLSRKTVNLATAAVGVALSLAVIFALVGPSEFLDLIGPDVMYSVIEYAKWAGVFFVAFWVVLNRWMGRRKLARKRWPARSQIVREVMFSICSQFVFLAVAFSLAFTESIGGANMYFELSTWDWLYIPLVTFLILAMDDTYFYWTHRMLHHPPGKGDGAPLPAPDDHHRQGHDLCQGHLPDQ